MLVTPSGLEIRIDLRRAFTLIARLWEKDADTDALRVLKTVQGIQCIVPFLGFVGAAVALFYGSAGWQIIAGHCLGRLVGKMITNTGFFVPGLVWVAMGWDRITGYGLLTLLPITTAWLLKGWGYAAAWLGGLFLGNLIVEGGSALARIFFHRNNIEALKGQSEIDFYSAYCLHAERLGIRRPFLVAAPEMRTGKWKKCLSDYLEKHPEALEMFMDSDYG